MNQTNTTGINATAVVDFIKSWFGISEQPAFFCSLANEKGDPTEVDERHVTTRDIEDVTSFLNKWNRPKRGSFFCVSTLRAKTRRNKEHVAEINGLHGDVDFKDVIDDPATILRRLMELPLPPSWVVSSGNGYHVYWAFKESIKINIVDGRETTDRIEAALKLLCDLIGGDFKVCHVAALMRMPGTFNSKRDEWKEVVTVESTDHRYELDDIEEMLSIKSPIVLRKVREQPNTAGESGAYSAYFKSRGYKPPVDVEKRLAAMMFMGGGDAAVHATHLSVSASLMKSGRDIEEAVALVLEATKAAAGEYGTRWNWKREEREIRKMCVTGLKKYPPKATGAGIGHNSDARCPLHIEIARVFFDKLKHDGRDFCVVPDLQGIQQFWRFDNGLWSLAVDVDTWLDRELAAILRGIGHDDESSNKLISEARGFIKREPGLVSKEPIVFDNHGMVPVKGFLIDPRTLALIPMQRSHYCTWHLDVDYDANARCPWWEQMLADAFADQAEAERAAQLMLLQDFTGAALIDRKPKTLNRALVAQGGSDSGKTALITVMSGLISDRPIATTFDALSGPHGLQEFARRAPWVLHEAFDQGTWHLSARVKSILSGDPLSINPKGVKAITVPIHAPAFWATNHPPKFKESTEAMVNRMLIVKMHGKFIAGDEVGTTLEARKNGYKEPHDFVLATEKAGLLNWALIGLQRVLHRGFFINTAEGNAALDEVRLDSNVMAGFVEDCVDYDPGKMLSSPDLYMAFASWWKEVHGEGRQVPSPDFIGRSISALANPRIAQDAKKFKNRDGTRFYPGIVLNVAGLSHFLSELMMTLATNAHSSFSRVSSAGETAKPIPESWADHPQIKRLRGLAKNDPNQPRF